MSRAYFLHMQENPDSFESPEEFTRIRCGFDPLTGEETVGAVQSAKDECDINRIIQRFDRDGVLTHLSNRVGQFMDVAEFTDFRSVMDQVGRATEFFMQAVPASIREKFGNDPALFLDALMDPSRKAELEELGVFPKVKEEAAGAPTPPAAPAQ